MKNEFNIHEVPKTPEDKAKILKIALSQLQEIGPNLMITCPCGERARVASSFRCFHCGIYFCYKCAVIHFGERNEK